MVCLLFNELMGRPNAKFQIYAERSNLKRIHLCGAMLLFLTQPNLKDFHFWLNSNERLLQLFLPHLTLKV